MTFVNLFRFLVIVAPIASTAHHATAGQIGPIKLVLKPSERAEFEPFVIRSVKTALKYYKTHHGIEVTKPISLVVSQDPDFIAQARYRAHRKRWKFDGIQKLARARCKNAQRVTGATDVRVMRICFNSPVKVTGVWLDLNRKKIDTVIVHEFMHVIQQQLAKSGYLKKGQRPTQGPKWLVEGAAMYAHAHFQALNGGRKIRLPYALKQASRTKKTLKDFSEGRKILAREGYALSGFAAFLLAERFGQDQILDYWKNLAAGKGWAKTFKKTFGIGLKDYVALVEKLRKSEDEARAWINQS